MASSTPGDARVHTEAQQINLGPPLPLASVAELKSGGTPAKGDSRYWGGDIPWLTPKDMGDFTGETQDCVTPLAVGNGTRIAPANSVFVAVRGMSLHNEIRIVLAPMPMSFNQDIKAIVATGVDARFLYYVLSAAKPELLSMVESAGHGTGVLPTDKIAGLPIPRLTGPEQVAIANVLGALDNKIELNRRTGRTLKATVRALFKDWFVEFGPVRAKSHSLEPYLTAEIWKLFPNEFDRLGQPLGWRRSTLAAEIASSGGLIQTGPFGSQLHASEYSQNGTPVVMPKDLIARRVSADSVARIPHERTVPLARHRLEPGDIVFSRRGDVGRFAIAGERERGWLCGTGCLLVRPGVKWKSLAFLVETLDDVSTQEWIVRHAIGATMPNLNTGILGDVPMLLPSEDLLEIFQQVCGAFQVRAEALSVESESLVALRDALMPKLISGAVRINGAERFIEAVAG